MKEQFLAGDLIVKTPREGSKEHTQLCKAFEEWGLVWKSGCAPDQYWSNHIKLDGGDLYGVTAQRYKEPVVTATELLGSANAEHEVW